MNGDFALKTIIIVLASCAGIALGVLIG